MRKARKNILYIVLVAVLAAKGYLWMQPEQVISHGESVVLSEHVIAGKFTLFEFNADT